jgi:hypothetical protein
MKRFVRFTLAVLTAAGLLYLAIAVLDNNFGGLIGDLVSGR